MGKMNACEIEQDCQGTGITLPENLGIKNIYQHNGNIKYKNPLPFSTS